MSATLEAWNKAEDTDAFDAMIACCGARRWATAMVSSRPIDTVLGLSETADRVWRSMTESDWIEAFACHPRIGGREAARATAMSTAWSSQEQSSVSNAKDHVLSELAEGNSRYEEKFGFTYIVCATGKSAEEMIALLKRRLAGNRDAELREAAEQQRQIMQIRLGKWLIE